MATTTIWVPGASALAGSKNYLTIRRNDSIEDTGMIFGVQHRHEHEGDKFPTIYIPVPTISVLNNDQLYLKRFTVNFEFLEDTTARLALHFYDGSDEIFSDPNPIFLPLYERILKPAHKINKSLLLGIEIIDIPRNLPWGAVMRINNASFDLQTPELLSRGFIPMALAITTAALLLRKL